MQKGIIHACMLSGQSMTMFVLNLAGQLVHVDMATDFETVPQTTIVYPASSFSLSFISW